MSWWWALARADRVNVLRDPMLLVATVVAVPLGALVRLVRAPLADFVAPWVDAPLFEALAVSFVLVLPAMMAGTVQGFLLLEERDDHIDAAIAVSPVGLVGLWRWRLGASFGVSIVTGAVGWAISGLPGSFALPLALLVAAVHGPLVTLIIATGARDKVQGLAWSKVTSLVAVAQVALVLPEPLAWLGSPFPVWWLARGWWTGSALGMAVGLLVALAGCGWLSPRTG